MEPVRVEWKKLRKPLSNNNLCLFSSFAIRVFALLTLVGCSSEQPFAATTNLRLTEEENTLKLVLDPSDQARALRDMRAVAGDHVVVRPPATSGSVRWSDVPLALDYACAEVEMAIVQTIFESDGYVFKLKTIDDRPGEIKLCRVDDERVYVAEATVGRLGDDEDLASRLLVELDRQLHLFGAKRKLIWVDD